MFRFLTDQGLNVSPMTDVLPLVEGSLTPPTTDNRLNLQINPNIFDNTYDAIGGMGQALYLVEEQVRNSPTTTGIINTAKVGGGTTAASFAYAVGRQFSRFADGTMRKAEAEPMDRRVACLLIGASTVAIAAAASFVDMSDLAPDTLQARLQGGTLNTVGYVCSQPQLQSALGDTYYYQSY